MKRGNISRKKHCLFLLCKKYNAIYESVISYNNKILKVTNMISPEGIMLNSDVYDSVIDGIERIHNKDIDYLKYDLKDYDDELPVLRDIPWYEKALNAVGGTAVSLIRDNVEGLCFIPYAIVDGMFGTNLNERLQNCLDDAEEYLINNVVTDEQFYYYGKTVGNVICMVEGAVFIANGLTTIAGGITLLGGGVALSSTGVGAIFGGAAIAVSIPAVAAGAIAILSGGGIMYSSMNNFEENLSKAQDAKTSKVDDVKIKDDIKELDGKIEKVDDGVNKITDDIIRDGSQLENGKLKPNITYQTGEHEYIYKTNDSGFIKNAHADKLQLKTHEGRLNHNTNTIGKEIGDQAGHVFGDRFGGSPELDNLVSQAQKVNQSKFKILENKWAKSLKEGKTVSVDIDIHYDTTGTGRPISFDVYYTIDDISYFETIIN